MSKYCKIARKILKRNIVCGADCPLLKDCPRIIMEDASDEAIEKAIDSMISNLQEYWEGGK